MTPLSRKSQVLILAGARETAAVAQAIEALLGRDAVRVVTPPAQSDTERLSGDAAPDNDALSEVLNKALTADAVTHLVDVSHPFAQTASSKAAAAAARAGALYGRFVRPPWQAQSGDDWTEVEDAAAAARGMPPGARVFATTGRESLPGLAAYDGTIFLRQTTRHNGTPTAANTQFVFGTPPFPVAAESDLFRSLGIDVLLARNTGGTAGASKIDAARSLGLPIWLLQRPPAPGNLQLHHIPDLLQWLEKP